MKRYLFTGFVLFVIVLSVMRIPAEKKSTSLGKLLSAKKIITGKDNSPMVYIPAGEFIMGSNSGYSDEKPVHKVYLDAYWIDKYEVTFKQYDKFCEATGRKKPTDNGWGREKRPVINVTWNNAVTYAEYYGKRLPTEAEWEKACRGGTKTPFHYGDSLSSEQANFDGHYPYGGASKGEYRQKTMSVGSFKPNSWGLYDMHGNVWEWCADWYDENYYKNSPDKNPQGSASGSYLVLRGGSWGSFANNCRAAYRYWNGSGCRSNLTGFRCVSLAKTQ